MCNACRVSAFRQAKLLSSLFGLVSEVLNFETRTSPLDIFTFQLTFRIEFAKEDSYV